MIIDDFEIRSCCISHAIDLNEKATSAQKITEDAAVFYKFMKPEKAELIEISSGKGQCDK